MGKLLTIDDLSAELGVKKSWVRSMILKRKIPYIKVGHHIRFEESTIKKWLSENAQPARMARP